MLTTNHAVIYELFFPVIHNTGNESMWALILHPKHTVGVKQQQSWPEFYHIYAHHQCKEKQRLHTEHMEQNKDDN
jgi:hypothetical protein